MTLMVWLKTGDVEGYKATRFVLDRKELYVQTWKDNFRKIPLEDIDRIVINGVCIWDGISED